MTHRTQRHAYAWPLTVVALAATTACIFTNPALAQQPRAVPTFAVDPSWAKVPDKYRLGDISSIAIDAQDNAYVLHRPRTLKPDQAAMAAPAVVVFDPAGNFIKAWGGARRRLRMGRARARHPHRPQGLCLDRRQPVPDLGQHGAEGRWPTTSS